MKKTQVESLQDIKSLVENILNVEKTYAIAQLILLYSEYNSTKKKKKLD